MKTLRHRLALPILLTLNLQLSAFAQGTAFTYQGRLNSSGSPANGTYDLMFTLFDTNLAGVVIAGPVTNNATAVGNGLFTTAIDFGAGVFTGGNNWVEIAVRTNGGSTFSTLAPRQQLTPAPYAITAENLASVVQYNNTIPGEFDTIGGGDANTTSNYFATVGGGALNIASGPDSTVAGGELNNSSGLDATVGGGYANYSAGEWSTVGGGYQNSATGVAATVCGGYNNTAAGNFSFAAGFAAHAIHDGSFVWADSTGVVFASTGNNQFLIRASGGVGIGTASPQSALHVRGGFGSQLVLQDNVIGHSWSINNDNNDNLVFVPNTGTGGYIYRGNGNYFSLSDLRLKQDIKPLGGVLDRVLQLRPVSYRFRSAPAEAPLTLGLIAQEVEPLFPEVVGERAGLQSLAYTELVPVTIRAVQELNQKVEEQLKEKDSEIQKLQKQNDNLRQRLDKLETFMNEYQEGAK